MNMPTVLVPLAQGCEELEAVTIIDVLTRAEIEVVTASLDNNQVITASRGVQLISQTTLDNVLDDRFDMVVLPGGLPGADHLNEDSRIHALLQKSVKQGGLAAAICAAPKVLVTAGLLDNKQATSYPGVIDEFPGKSMQYLNQSVVEDTSVITSRGPATAMEFALFLVEKLKGVEVRESVAKGLLFN